MDTDGAGREYGAQRVPEDRDMPMRWMVHRVLKVRKTRSKKKRS
jgi:hypothetical protein